MAIWFSSSNTLSVSIFHSGGTEERIAVGTSVATLDGTTQNTIRYYLYDNTIKVWVNDSLELDSTYTNSLENVPFQLGQFKNTTGTRLNGNSPENNEGIHGCDVYILSSEPTEAQMLALEHTFTDSWVQRQKVFTVTGIEGYVGYLPTNYDNSGSTKYETLLTYHGAGDGANSKSLSEMAQIGIADYMRQNRDGFLKFAVQSTTGGWETNDRVETSSEYLTNTSVGVYKDVINHAKISYYGYSAGANGIEHALSLEGTEMSKAYAVIFSAGILNEIPTHESYYAGIGTKFWVFCATGDAVAGTTTSETFAAMAMSADPSLIRLTRFSSLAGDVHAAMQDIVYDASGIGEAQETGAFGTNTVPYYEWTTGTMFDFIS